MDLVVHPKLVVSRKSGEAMLRQMDKGRASPRCAPCCVIEIRARRDDDRASFRSGDTDLDRFVHQFAGQNQFRHHPGVTYVAVQDQKVLGFATVAAAHAEIDDLPSAVRRKLPRDPPWSQLHVLQRIPTIALMDLDVIRRGTPGASDR